MEEKKTQKLSTKEIVWYSIAGVFGVFGLVFFIFGCVGNAFPGKWEDNWINNSAFVDWLKSWSKMDMYWWGLILIGIGALILCISLSNFANVGDRDTERANRRAQRRVSFATEEAPVVEVKAEDKPAEEAKAE